MNYFPVQKEGNRTVNRKISYYNLDVIISVGYRVKSIRGTQFRIWANKILKDYLLKGYALNQRIERVENKLIEHEQKFDLLISSSLLPKEGIFYDGQVFDAYEFVSQIIKSAQREIILIDNYIDEITLGLLSKKNKQTKVIVYTGKVTSQLEIDLKKFREQYGQIEIHHFQKSHDRFLIIDKKTIYHIGASLKDAGKKWFAFSKIGIDVLSFIENLKEKEKR